MVRTAVSTTSPFLTALRERSPVRASKRRTNKGSILAKAPVLSATAARLPMSGELKTAKGQILQFDGDCVASLEPVASEIDAAYASGFTVIGADSPTGELRNVPRSDTSELPRYLEVLGPVVGG